MFSVYDDNAIMKEFDRVSNQPIENDMGGIVYGPNAVLENANEPIMESDDGTVVIKFANGCSVTLNKGKDGYVIGGSEGSSILSKLSGHLVNVELNNIQEGQPLRMSIKINDKFHGWHSGQPVSSVTNGEASNEDSQPGVETKPAQPAAESNPAQPAAEPNPEQKAAEPNPEQKAESDDGDKVVIKMNGGRKFVFVKKSDGTVVLKDAGGSRTLSEYEGREAKFNNPPKVGEKLSLTFFGQAITRDTVLQDTPLTTSDTIAYVGSSDPGASDSTPANSTVTVVTLDNGRKLTFKLSPMNVPDNPKLKYQGVLVDSDGESLKNYLNSQVRCFELAEGKPFVAALNVGGKWKSVYGGHSVKSVERQ